MVLATRGLSSFSYCCIKEEHHHRIPSRHWLCKEKQWQLVRSFIVYKGRKQARRVPLTLRPPEDLGKTIPSFWVLTRDKSDLSR